MSFYFISIGGSGARVLEALTHLCAAGLFPNQDRTTGHFYVMSIDPDTGNGNLTRTGTLLNYLKNFQNVDIGKETSLLKTSLQIFDPFCWSPAPTGKNLDDVIGFPIFKHTPVGKLYSSLYTQRERSTILDEGFRGRPSIGAAVIAKRTNEIKNNAAWNNLIAAVNNDVTNHGSAQIFLAGSIFGGTGAAGLPTIARLLKKQFAVNVENGKVRIGGALLLPYFSFRPTVDNIAQSGLFAYSDHFLTNTKAALRYYASAGGSGYNSIYFVGDESMTPTRKFSVGASTQCNDAHIVDLIAAMAALHFYYDKNIVLDESKVYYTARRDNNRFQWNDLPIIQANEHSTLPVQKLFVQFTRFIFAYLHIVKPVFADLKAGRIQRDAYPWYVDNLKDVDCNSNEVLNFESYAESFASWLNQVESSVSSVELIRRDFFSVKNGIATIEPQLFKELDYGTSNLTITTVQEKLLYSFFDRIRGRHRNQSFGRFLRRLYDGCSIN